MPIAESVGVDGLLERTVGRWQICPLWVLRGKMFKAAEKAVIIALFDLWHTTNRPSWFYGTTVMLTRLAGVSDKTFERARKKLIDKCIIEYKRGRQHQASSYHISQDFLNTLTTNSLLKDSLPLNTSTYSNGADLTSLDIQKGRIDLSEI